MADFKKAFQRTMEYEGGYVNDPDDPGGETYRGIARRRHPEWEGWEEIDRVKTAENFPRSLKDNRELDRSVRRFYKERFWDQFWGDRMPDQGIADELFDASVNIGVKVSVTFLQKGLNALNYNASRYNEVREDGIFGEKTLKALTIYLENDQSIHLLKILNILRGARYLELAAMNPTLEKYLKGWLKRIEIPKA